MPLIEINARDGRPEPAAHAGTLRDTLAAALAPIPDTAPVVVMIHGFRFSPRDPRVTPHRHILSLTPDAGSRKVLSWPRKLGFAQGTAREGLAIAFGWEARGTIWQAWAEAARAGMALAALIAAIRDAAPGRRVDVIAHSLGARVFLAALPVLPAGAIGRAILMTAAELSATAALAMDSPAGRSAEVMNVTSRENDLFDFALELLVAGGFRRGLGHGLPRPRANWVDIELDHAETLDGLSGIGYPVAAPGARICHWSPYLRPGIFTLYRAFLRDRAMTSPAHLRAVLASRPAPRWSRLLPRPGWRLPLPPMRRPFA